MKKTTDASSSNPTSPRGLGIVRAVGLGLGGLGAALWAARYAAQGTSTMWTDTARSFYVEDPNLGLVPTTDAWVWLGLEGLFATIGVALGGVALLWLARRLGEGKRLGTISGWLGTLAALVCLAAPALPIWAFVSGSPPAGALAVLPGLDDDDTAPSAGPIGLALDAGRWVPAKGTDLSLVAATITAGGETFDARFAGLEGEATLVPDDLARSRFRLSVRADTVKTGILLRDTHAKDYLGADTHPEIAVETSQLALGRSPERKDELRWRAEVDVSLIGDTLRLPARGRVRLLDASAREELGIAALGQALLVELQLEVPIASTKLDRSSFDGETITITARTVLTPAQAD